MTSRGLRIAALVVLGLLVPATSALAISYTFTASGTAGDGRPMHGEATFDFFDLTHLDLTLTNTAGPGELGGISSVLDGIAFLLSQGTLAQTGATSANGKLDCTAGVAACTPAPAGVVNDAGSFGWVLSGGVLEPVGFKPHGIVNANVTGDTDGIKNAPHNPYLNGPVTFHFSLTGAQESPTVSEVTLYFGTAPDSAPGTPGTPGTPVPEPGTLVLLGTGLASLGYSTRKRWFRGARG